MASMGSVMVVLGIEVKQGVSFALSLVIAQHLFLFLLLFLPQEAGLLVACFSICLLSFFSLVLVEGSILFFFHSPMVHLEI